MKLTVNGRDIELTASEARELHRQLNDIFPNSFLSPNPYEKVTLPEPFIEPEPWDKKWEVTC